jgi:hypothetical protein
VSRRLGELLNASDLTSVLTHEVGVEVANISASGCLVESNRRLDVGTVGALLLAIGEHEYRDDVRVVRVTQLHGASARWHVGVEFLWTSPPGPQSLRRMARLLKLASGQPVSARLEIGVVQ